MKMYESYLLVDCASFVQLKDKLTVREQSLEQKETALGEERVQLADAIQKIQIAETKAQQMVRIVSNYYYLQMFV